MKDLGSEKLTYLGISIQRNSNNIVVDQSKYLHAVLKKFNMQNCKGSETPMDVNFKLDENFNVDQSYEKLCRSLIGSLMYATVGSRPDLATSVYYLSRYQSKPSEELWKALKRILRYVKQTVNLVLIYSKEKGSSPLVGFADADWARDYDRKSTTGYLFKVYNNTVVWKSRKQATVALSTTEAEYISLCEATMEGCWIQKLLSDLNINVPSMTIYEDNQSTIKLIKGSDQKRLKHIEIKYNFVKQKVEEGKLTILYINTKYQIADILTKPIIKKYFKLFVEELGLHFNNPGIEEEC